MRATESEGKAFLSQAHLVTFVLVDVRYSTINNSLAFELMRQTAMGFPKGRLCRVRVTA